MKTLILSMFLLAQTGAMATEVDKPNGWQFYNFFGTYQNRPLTEKCSPLFHGSTFIGFKYAKDIVSLLIKSEFSTVGESHQYIRNSSYQGQDCYECDADAWSNETVGGDGINSATFHSAGQEPYNARKWSWSLEIIRRQNGELILRWGDCLVELVPTK